MSSPWRYARHELLYVAWALMEVALLTPLLLGFMPWARYWPAALVALWLLLLMLVPFNLNRALSLGNVPLARQRLVVVGGFLLALLLAIRLMVYPADSPFDLGWLGRLAGDISGNNPYWGRVKALFVSLALVWWRGIALGGRSIDVGSAGFRFRLLALLVVPLVIALSSTFLAWDTAPFIALFLLASLTAIALTRAEQVEGEKTGQAFAMNPLWFGLVVLASVLTAAAAGVVAVLMGGRTVPDLIAWLGPLWSAARLTVAATLNATLYLLSPLLFLFEHFLGWVFTLASRAFGPGLEEVLAQLQIAQNDPLFDFTPAAQEQANEPNRLVPILVMVVIIALVSLTLARLYQHRRPAEDEMGVAAGERLGATRSPSRSFGRRLRQRLAGWRHWRTAASIRRIYHQMSAAAAANGSPRLAMQTPYEYLPTLADLWPERTADLGLITDAYVRVRYGETPESQAEVDEVFQAWRRIEQTEPAGPGGTTADRQSS